MNDEGRIDSMITAVLSSAAKNNWSIHVHWDQAEATINGQTLSGTDLEVARLAVKRALELRLKA